MERVQITQHSTLGGLWFVGWLFTIGYLKLDFWMGLLGLVVWPYFLGSHFTPTPLRGERRPASIFLTALNAHAHAGR